MNANPFRLPLATRLLSLALAAAVSLGMLAGVEVLATGEPNTGLLARAHLSVKA